MFKLKSLTDYIDSFELQDSMFKACKDGDLDKVKDLFEQKVPLNRVTGESEFTLMHYATMGGHTKVALWLLENRAPFRFADAKMKRTPLHLACEIGNMPIIGALLARGANINGVDSKSCTPLHLACFRHADKTPEFRARLALRLFAAGADPKIENCEKFIPADYLDKADLKMFKAAPLPPFPRDVWVKILEFLPREELCTQVMLTCKALYNLSFHTLTNNFYKI